MDENVNGLAFSGGGIRSAAFSSGVLRRLLQRNTKIDFLSCVSGGGYTGTAYLDWKYRNGQKDDPKWHREFFNHMRERSGVMCNWQKPLKGIFDSVILLLMMVFVSIVMPVVMWGSYMFPMAYAIDFVFGGLLRAPDECEDETITPTPTSLAPDDNATTLEKVVRCEIILGTKAYDRITLFSVLAVFFCFFYLLGKKSRAMFRDKFFILSVLCGLLLAFTFIPYYIYYFFNLTPVWTKVLIIVFSIIVWFFFPILRGKASFVLVVYLFAYTVYWKVFKTTVFGVEYSNQLFYRLLFASGLVLWIVPVLGTVQQRLVYVFNRWRLQKAFYTKASVGRTGCLGIDIEDIFLMRSCMAPIRPHRLKDTEQGPLSLGDLETVKPQYLSNIVVNDWKVGESEAEEKYELLVMSPTEIERLDRRPDDEQFKNKLDPDDVDLSAAMATSAAAVARHMGTYDNAAQGFKQLQIVLGLGMGAAMVSDVQRLKRETCLLRMLPFIIDTILVLPLLVFPPIYFSREDKVDEGDITNENWVALGVFIFFGLQLMLTFFSVLRTGNKAPTRTESIARWFITNVPFVRFVRDMMLVVNLGPNPPPILRLSDGGHIENLALLPLLKRRLPKIVIVDGGHKENDSQWGDDLLLALSLARQKLHCSFIGLDGRDVIEDIKEKFVYKPKGQQPRSYRFKVHYYEKEDLYTEGTKAGEGEILLISPRHPSKGIKTEEPVTWKEALHDIDVDLEAGNWGECPRQTAQEVDVLTFCCCECCHGNKCQDTSKAMCGVFPQHVTANQFFTPRMFSAYHREGYSACVEAEAAEFLGPWSKNGES